MKRGRIVRDDAGAWAAASRGKKTVGLVISLLIALVMLLPLLLIVYFLMTR